MVALRFSEASSCHHSNVNYFTWSVLKTIMQSAMFTVLATTKTTKTDTSIPYERSTADYMIYKRSRKK